jgi:hypothetical protein
MFHQVTDLSSDTGVSQSDQITDSRINGYMQSRLSNSGVSCLNLFENSIPGILIAKKGIDLRRVFALVKSSKVSFNLSFVVKQSILCTASLVNFDDHDFGFEGAVKKN